MEKKRMMKPSMRALAKQLQQQQPVKHWTWDGLFLRRSCREGGDPACGQEQQQPQPTARAARVVAGASGGEQKVKEWHWNGLSC